MRAFKKCTESNLSTESDIILDQNKIPEWSDRADFIRRVEIQKKAPPKAEFLDIAFATEDYYVLADRFVPDDGIIETATIIRLDSEPSQPMKVDHFSRLK